MDEQGALFGDAVPMPLVPSICSDQTPPSQMPAFEIVGAGFIAAMVNRGLRVVATRERRSLAGGRWRKTIDFLSCVNDDVGDGFFRGI